MIKNIAGMDEHQISLFAHKLINNIDNNKKGSNARKFNDDLIVNLKRKVDEFDHLRSLPELRNVVEIKKSKIDTYLTHFHPILNIAEGLLIKSIEEFGLKAKLSDFYLAELRESIHKSNVWETLRLTRMIINRLHLHINELANREVFERMLDDLHLFAENLHRAEMEYAEAVHQNDMAELEHYYAKLQLSDVLDQIMLTTSKNSH